MLRSWPGGGAWTTSRACQVVSTAYGRILETMADENIEWYTSVIKKAWEELGKAGNRSTGGDSGVGDIATLL